MCPNTAGPRHSSDFRDEFDVVIRNGALWTGLPPDDSYSHVSDPGRFAPLQAIAVALIEHPRAAYRAVSSAVAMLSAVSGRACRAAVGPRGRASRKLGQPGPFRSRRRRPLASSVHTLSTRPISSESSIKVWLSQWTS